MIAHGWATTTHALGGGRGGMGQTPVASKYSPSIGLKYCHACLATEGWLTIVGGMSRIPDTGFIYAPKLSGVKSQILWIPRFEGDHILPQCLNLKRWIFGRKLLTFDMQIDDSTFFYNYKLYPEGTCVERKFSPTWA